MNITIVTPAAAGSRHGNRNTAARWARLLRDLGHRVDIQVSWNGAAADLLIALHARRSHGSIDRFAGDFPGRALVVVLTGTDLYRDIRTSAAAQQSLAWATRLVVLQEMGVVELAPPLRTKTRIIYQSAQTVAAPPPLRRCFEVVVSGHLREEKDPFRCAAALAQLPAGGRIAVTHMGGAMSSGMTDAARRWAARETRYRWLEGLPHGKALRILARSRLMVLSSRMEGGRMWLPRPWRRASPSSLTHFGKHRHAGKGLRRLLPGRERARSRPLAMARRKRSSLYRLLQMQCPSGGISLRPRTSARAYAGCWPN